MKKFLLVISFALLLGNYVYAQQVDGIKFEIKQYNKSTKKAIVSLSYPVFVYEDNPVVADSLNKIVNRWMGLQKFSKKKKKYIEVTPKDILKEYEECYEGPLEDMQTEVDRKVTVMLNDHGIVTLEFQEYLFTGGAHGNSYLSYLVYDLTGAKRVKLGEMFVKGYINKLTSIGEVYFRKERGLKSDENLTDAGYWFEEDVFRLNDNFYLTGNGLGFTYNQYEIACYAMGITTFTIPFKDLKILVSPTSILKNFIK